MIKKRNAVWAAILSLITPGLGHIYAGDLRKGLTIIAIEYGTFFLAGLFGFLSTSYGIAALAIFIIVFYLFVITSSVKLALNNKEYHMQPYNRWYWYLSISLVVSLIANVLFSYSRGHSRL